MAKVLINMSATLWRRFGALVKTLKENEMINAEESRSSIIRDLVAAYVIAKTKEIGIYEVTSKEMEGSL